MAGNFERLVERISNAANVDGDEIIRRVEAKRAKLSGLISKEGAAQIVAAELGVSFDNERIKLSEIVQGMKRVNVVGKVTKLFPVREFSKNGKEGKIGSFLLGDDSSNVRCVLWDMNHISLIENNKINEGVVIEISNGSVRNGELHLSGFSDIKESNENIQNVMEKREYGEGNLVKARAGENIKVRGVVVQTFEPRYFESKKTKGEKGVVWNVVLDDGSETMRAVLFGEVIKNFGFSDDELFDLEKFNKKRENVLGEEKIVSGNVRMNSYFNILEIAAEDINDVDSDELVKKLELKAN